jgi:hypothetical protein
MSDALSRKDELFNDLVDDCKSRGVDFYDTLADSDGRYILQVRKQMEFFTPLNLYILFRFINVFHVITFFGQTSALATACSHLSYTEALFFHLLAGLSKEMEQGD